MKDIPGWLTAHEAGFLASAATATKNLPGVIVEIGSFHGKSTIELARAGEPVWAIDPHKGYFSGGRTSSTLLAFLENIRDAHADRVVHPVVKTSREASVGWKRPIKFLFIDGLHDVAHARQDYTLWTPFVLEDGIVAMHDAFCGWPGAGAVALTYIVRSSAYKEIGVVGSIIYGIRGTPGIVQKIRVLFRRCVIEMSQWLYGQAWIPRPVSFILVHKFLKLFLINRFTSLR